MLGNVTLRSAEPRDTHAAAELHYRSWVATYGPLLQPDQAGCLTLAERLEHWEWLLRERGPDRDAVVATRDGVLVGLVEWELGPEGDRSVGEVHAIHVAPDARGQGLGTLLLDAAVEALRRSSVHRIVLWVLEDNRPARRFYERLGWARDGDLVVRPLGGFPGFPAVAEVRYALDVAD